MVHREQVYSYHTQAVLVPTYKSWHQTLVGRAVLHRRSPPFLSTMATALEIATDAKHPDPIGYDEKGMSDRGASPLTATNSEFRFLRLHCENASNVLTWPLLTSDGVRPTLAEYMQHAEVSRAREAGAAATGSYV